jgi:hypothetical protein
LVLAGGLGLTALAWAGAGLTAIGLLLAGWSARTGCAAVGEPAAA